MTAKIFDPKGAGQFTAQVGSDGSRGWHSPLSYLRAGDVLVEHATERGGSVALSALPICFLYQHAAELTLKQLIFLTEELITVSVALGCVDAAHERKPDDVEKHVVKRGHRIGDLLALLAAR